jgi:uncharacterized protein (DUF1697 family)
MTRFVALLRAVNVGGRVVKMERLRELFADMGFAGVQTFIASGNVAFQTSARDPAVLERRIEKQLRTSLGYEVAAFVRSAEELRAVVDHEPFARADAQAPGHGVYVAFLRDRPTIEAVEHLGRFRTPGDEFHVHGREVYWLRRGKLTESAFTGAMLERTMRMPATLRSMNTVQKWAARILVVVAWAAVVHA